ncbi:MAG: aspartate kinase [Candidatus Korarchaeota archaeon]|nr:aspartate kinase [Candidatus Korarchaeota archaeon]
MVGKRVVVKLGGSVLSSTEDFIKMASIAKKELELGHELVLVVSAMKGHTDELISLARQVGADGELLDSISGLGEVLSARLMAAALNSLGVESVAIDPSSPLWPIYTDDRFGDANPDLPRTCGAAISGIEPLLGRTIPVICGYVGKTRDGKLTTLGRGGSDTTAVTLARCLNADEVVLVKDSQGLMSADPKLVKNAVQIRYMDAEDALMMSLGGAKVLHHKALRYLAPTVRMRIVSSSTDRFTSGGTIVQGHIPDLNVEVYDKPITMVTLITNGLPIGNLNLKGIISVSTLEKSMILYVQGDEIETVKKLHKLVDEGKAKAISVRKDVAMIKVWGSAIEEVPGVIYKISEPLTSHGVNIFGLQTVHNKIAVFVDWDKKERAATELSSILG